MTCWLCGFKTTELVTNSEASTCNNGSCRICVTVAKVDEEINQAVATLRRLIAKRCDLRSEQNRSHDPVRRLPVELKNHIFQLLLPSRDEWGQIEAYRAKEGVKPSFLASVCRGWRDIAWSNPFLWSSMHITIGISRLTSDLSSLFNFLREWILRSGTLQLSFHIRVVDCNERSRKLLAALLDAMNQCSIRVQSLSLDLPYPLLRAFQDRNFQWHRLMQLRIDSLCQSPDPIDQAPGPLVLNPTAGPEKIQLCRSAFQSLQISWNHLTSAMVIGFDLEDITRLFQHASQMTDCYIFSPLDSVPNFTMPPIIHPRLKTLRLCYGAGSVQPMLLGSLTLPCLQEFNADQPVVLSHLPALVHRSSCPLTRFTLSNEFRDRHHPPNDLQPLPGVTDVVVDGLYYDEPATVKKLLLEGYFPDLRRLTLRLQSFLVLWKAGVIPLLLDRRRLRPDGSNEGRLDKIVVVDPDHAAGFDRMWNSKVGEQLRALNISPKEDGFDII